MGNLRACLAVATLALAACGSDHAKVDAAIVIVDAPPDAKEFFDAPPPSYDFTCTGNAAPTTATAEITLSGTVQEIGFNGMVTITAVDMATVDACAAGTTCMGGQNKLGTDTTDASGNFSVGPLDTSSMPLDSYLAMTKTGVRTMYVYPPQPFTADQGMIPVVTFSSGLLGLLPDCGQNDTMNGTLVLAVTDCANAPISDTANVMLSIKQNNMEVTGTSIVDLGTINQQAAGTFLVCNVPPNPTTTVGATWNGMALRAHDVQVVIGTTTSTLLRPGYF